MDLTPKRQKLAHLSNSRDYSIKINSLVEMLNRLERDKNEAVVLMDFQNNPHPITGIEIWTNAMRAARFLMDKGLRKGDPVVLMLPTSKEFIYLFFGILRAGGIPVPVSRPAGPEHLEKHFRHIKHIIGNCEAKFLIVFNRMEIFNDETDAADAIESEILVVEDIFQEAVSNKSTAPFPRIEGNDVALLQYTSGTTSQPKGVVLSHKNILNNIHSICITLDKSEEETSISWLPLYHDMGLIGILLANLYWGCRLILMRPEAFIFKPQWWLQNIGRFKCTISAAPNFGYHYSATRIKDSDLEGIDLSSWRIALNGAEFIDMATLTKFYDRFKKFGLRTDLFLPVYGMAENSLATTFPSLDQPTVIRRFDRKQIQENSLAIASNAKDPKTYIDLVSVGYPLVGQEVKIADDNGLTLHEGRIGQILVKSPSLTQGYFNNINATRQAIKDGWLRTGDLGFIMDGRLFVSGRIKEIIIKRGRNIYPYDVERLAATVKGIRLGSCAAFAMNNEDQGTEDLVLVCESSTSEAEAISAIKKQIENTILINLGFRPDRIIIVAKGMVPKTTSGKIQRIACRQMFLNGSLNSLGTDNDIQMNGFEPATATCYEA